MLGVQVKCQRAAAVPGGHGGQDGGSGLREATLQDLGEPRGEPELRQQAPPVS